jgi:predicted transcriptional regulator of viral defense system
VLVVVERMFIAHSSALGAIGLSAYTFKGIHEEFQKKRGANIKQYVVAAQKSEGELDLEVCTQEEKDEIIRRWHEMKKEKRRRKSVL